MSQSIDEVADNVLLTILKYYRNGTGNVKSAFRFGDGFTNEKPMNIYYQNIRQIKSNSLGIVGGGIVIINGN